MEAICAKRYVVSRFKPSLFSLVVLKGKVPYPGRLRCIIEYLFLISVDMWNEAPGVEYIFITKNMVKVAVGIKQVNGL